MKTLTTSKRPKKKARSGQFNIRLSKEEWSQCTFLAEHYGISVASVVRMLLKKEERELDAKR